MRVVGEVCEELATLRLDDRSDAIATVVPAIRTALDIDNVLVYSLAETLEGWGIVRWAQDGNANLFRRAFAEAITAGAPWPTRRMRSRPGSATGWSIRSG